MGLHVRPHGARSGRPGRDFPLAGLAEPQIEPEIIFGFAASPAPEKDEAGILACVDWVAHGFELVQSIFPAWKFALADTVAAYGLHGALMIGPRHPIAGQREDWLRRLTDLEIDLTRDGTVVDHGRAVNVLGGPVSALRYLIAVLVADPVNPPIAAGEIVTTGTLTRAFPVAPGQAWRTALTGVPLEGIAVRFV